MDQTKNNERNDLPRLHFLKGKLEKIIPNFKLSFKEEEDYNIDCTAEWNGIQFPLEAKTYKKYPLLHVEEKKFDDYWLMYRPSSIIRYTQNVNATQDEVRNDRTPRPEWLCKGTLVMMLNARAEMEGVDCKMDKINKEGGGACYLTSDSIVFFSPEALKEAFLGYVWLYMYTDEEFGKKKGKTWQCKALFDIFKATKIILNIKTPKSLVS